MCSWRDRYGALGRQLDGLRGQAASWDNEAEAALAAAKQAQQQSELETAAGNYDLGKALMEEAIRYVPGTSTSQREGAAGRNHPRAFSRSTCLPAVCHASASSMR